MARAANPSGVLMPVPTAVPPSGSSRTRGSTESSRSTAYLTVAAYAESSCPSVTGVASMRCVRPAFTRSANSSALASSDPASTSSAGIRSSTTARVAATWIAVGKVSLLDWLALTWSLGWTSVPARAARVATTSLAFMLELVPEPVWKTSTGKASSCSPAATAAAAVAIAPACSSLSTPSSPLASAAAALTCPRAWTSAGSIGVPLIGKFSTARWVWARHSACAGTCTSPIESCSVRNSWPSSCPRSLTLPTLTVPGTVPARAEG